MLQQLRTAVSIGIGLTVLTGAMYPLVVTAIAQLAFPMQAGGSLIRHGGKAVGSKRIGQSFSGPEYFWGRLSATTPFPYNAAASRGSNFGPLHPGLVEAAARRIAALQGAGASAARVPVDLVTASASGLDPHISVAAAAFQVQRVAASRKIPVERVRELVRQCTAGRQFGVLGEPRVHVLQLNLALDQGNGG